MAKVTRFQRVPLNVAGGSNETRSRSVSVAKLSNWYPEPTPAGTSNAALMPFPGITAISSISDYEPAYHDRGMHVFNGVTYFVNGAHLYKLDSALACTQIGVVGGSNYCSFADNGGVMVIFNGSIPYQYDGTTLSQISAITFSPTVVDYIGTYFVFNSDSDQFWVSNSFSVVVEGDNVAISESSPDTFTAPKAFGQMLYLFGTDSIEPWAIATGSPPFERATQAIMERVGCSAKHGITNTVEFVYFIDKSGIPYKMKGFSVAPFAPIGVIAKIQTYDLTQYRARNLTFDGQHFVIFDFYANNRTWCYSETTDTWFQLDSGPDGDRYQAGSNCFNYNLNIFIDNSIGIIYKLDFENFVNSWGPVIREKTFEFVAGEKLGSVRGVYEMSKVVFGLEAGVGLVSGQGEVPVLGVQCSTDGKTWSQEQFIEIGRSGEFTRKVEWFNMLQFQQLAIRTRLYDPVGLAFFSAAIDVREAGY